MFGSIGMQELIVILVIALLVFGPKRLPEIGKSIGEAIRGFRRAMSEVEEIPSAKTRETDRNEGGKNS